MVSRHMLVLRPNHLQLSDVVYQSLSVQKEREDERSRIGYAECVKGVEVGG